MFSVLKSLPHFTPAQHTHIRSTWFFLSGQSCTRLCHGILCYFLLFEEGCYNVLQFQELVFLFVFLICSGPMLLFSLVFNRKVVFSCGSMNASLKAVPWSSRATKVGISIWWTSTSSPLHLSSSKRLIHPRNWGRNSNVNKLFIRRQTLQAWK